jgi:2-keto-4-pentenoate hydratase/2-oxohepta-3-ene-1,7-dioic acid hydratase in catechol pathway
MRIASWSWGGRAHVGTVSPSGGEVTPLAVADPERGALGVIQALARGEALPSVAGARLPLDAVELRAPLPRPLRNVWCVGRNYHAHAAELAESVFRASLPVEHAWPIVFTKVPNASSGRATTCACRDLRSRARSTTRASSPSSSAAAAATSRSRARWTTSSATRSSTT